MCIRDRFIAGGFQGGEDTLGKERLKEEDVALAPVVVFQHIQAQAEGVAQEDVAHMHEQHENDLSLIHISSSRRAGG